MAKVRFDGDINDLIDRLDRFEKKALVDLPKGIADTYRREAETTRNRLGWTEYGTGAFSDSLVINETVESGHASVEFYSTMSVYSSNGRSYNLGKLLEEGVDPHQIVPVDGVWLRFWSHKLNRVIQTDVVNHPGFEAKYYRKSEGGVFHVTWNIAASKVKFFGMRYTLATIMRETRRA